MVGTWFMPTTKIKCYSYIRWSSEDQAKGSSYERQRSIAESIANEHGLELIEILDDDVSAYRGKNIEKGKFGDFIDAVRDKVIPADSWLTIENLDRITRQSPVKAQHLFIELLELGLTIVTGMDRKIYTYSHFEQSPHELMLSIVLFMRAHEESATKSRRTNESALAIIRRHQDGERDDKGRAFAIESVGNNIWWSYCKNKVVEKHELYYPIAEKIVQLILKGWGNYRIVQYLNNSGVEPPTRNKHNSWSSNLVAKFYKNRALIGEKSITIMAKSIF